MTAADSRVPEAPAAATDKHQSIQPKILYFGTPVALVTTLSPDGNTNIGPTSSVWALGQTVVMGWAVKAQTLDNLDRERECVINLPGPELMDRVEALASLTGRNPPAKPKIFRYESDKFRATGLTPAPAKTVRPPRITECALQLEAKVTAVHHPRSRDEASFRIVEASVEHVHALPAILKPGTNHIDVQRWSPLLYVFRHYFGTGAQLGRTFRDD